MIVISIISLHLIFFYQYRYSMRINHHIFTQDLTLSSHYWKHWHSMRIYCYIFTQDLILSFSLLKTLIFNENISLHFYSRFDSINLIHHSLSLFFIFSYIYHFIFLLLMIILFIILSNWNLYHIIIQSYYHFIINDYLNLYFISLI